MTDILAQSTDSDKELAAIQYMGVEGASQECVDAVVRLIQCGERITDVAVLTCQGEPTEHALLLTVAPGDQIAIKSGFASGYGGEGPSAFSYILQLLDDCNAELREYDVSRHFLRRLDASALTAGDIKSLGRRASPRRVYSYISDRDEENSREGTLWKRFPPVLPFGIVDRRIMDLAKKFGDDPDKCLMSGYRRLEDLVRERIGSADHSARLMATAFQGSKAVLTWPNCDEGENVGRANLFIGAYQAYRNPRAHREQREHFEEQLCEFLLLNQLYRLESTAVPRAEPRTDSESPSEKAQ